MSPDPDSRKDQILDCAKQLFARDGIKATTMSSIARQAQTAKPVIYQYFDSKDTIVCGVIEREIDNLKAWLNRDLSPEANPLVNISQIWANAIEYYERDDFLMLILKGNGLGLPPYLHEKFVMAIETYVVDLLENMVKSAVESNMFIECDSRIAAYVGYKIYQAGTYGRTATMRDFSPTQIMQKTMLIMGWGIMNLPPRGE